ncbi:hypothetical protein [Scytonema sp. PCC 10023]|uniref:hypothetical protein n=1 Tax=Scytonema sp. PCC 10023 TaxID=1680591 RepID=UPI0039C67ABB
MTALYMVSPVGGVGFRPAKLANPEGIDLLPCIKIHDNTKTCSKSKYTNLFVSDLFSSLAVDCLVGEPSSTHKAIHEDSTAGGFPSVGNCPSSRSPMPLARYANG